jgi:hypothetical protein
MRRSPVVLALLLLAAPSLALPSTDALICDGARCNYEATTTQGPANEVFIAVDPSNSQHIVAVAKDYSLGPSNACGVTRVWVGYYTSFDGGKTWTDGLLPGYPGDTRGSLLKGYGCVSDPTVAIDGDGTVYVGGLPIDGPGGKSGVITFMSTDGGITFPTAAWSIEDSQSSVDKNWLAVDPVSHVVYTTWTNFGGETGIHAAVAMGGPIAKAAGGLKFLPPACLSCGSGLGGQGSFIAIAQDGTTYVSWISGSRIVLTSSTTHGLSWGTARSVVTITGPRVGATFRTPTLPQLAIDRGAGGRLYATWQDGRDGDSDIYMAASPDGGATWGAAVRVNQDASTDGKKQFFPSVCVGPGGVVRAAWIDTRDDPNNYLLNTYGATSTTGGSSWTDQKLTTASSDPKYSHHQTGSIFMGDYLGVACAADGTAYAVWTDTRNLAADVFVAHWT